MSISYKELLSAYIGFHMFKPFLSKKETLQDEKSFYLKYEGPLKWTKRSTSFLTYFIDVSPYT